MYRPFIIATILTVGTCIPTIVESGFAGNDVGGWQGALSLGVGGGASGGGGGDWAGAASSYGISGGHDGGSSEGGSIGGDFHHGVSVVSTGGGEHKSTIFDLTNQGGGDGHNGPYGGSFVASSKYSAAGHGGGGNGGGHSGFGGGLGGYGVSEQGTGFAEHYSDVLGAGDAGYEALAHGGSIGGGGHEGLSHFH